MLHVVGFLMMYWVYRSVQRIETTIQEIKRDGVRYIAASVQYVPPNGNVGGFVATPQNPRNDSPLIVLAFALTWLFASNAFAAEPAQMMALDLSIRSKYANPDGSCVQCSLGMVGCHCNDLNAAYLLWDSEFGPAERGGSIPSRVESYCDRRGIKAWSVTGRTPDDTWPWLIWAAKTGRFAAFGCGQAHFQTLYGYDPQTKEWFVCNNNSTNRIDKYSDSQLRQLHAACGPWVVILEKPSSPPPEIVCWWKK